MSPRAQGVAALVLALSALLALLVRAALAPAPGARAGAPGTARDGANAARVHDGTSAAPSHAADTKPGSPFAAARAGDGAGPGADAPQPTGSGPAARRAQAPAPGAGRVPRNQTAVADSADPPRQGAAGSGAPAPGKGADRFPVDAAGITRAVEAVVPEIKQCYAGWRKQNPALAGALRVRMTIEPDPDDPSAGKVTGAQIAQSGLEHAALEGCVLNALSELELERPKDDKVVVQLPFDFDPVRRSTAARP